MAVATAPVIEVVNSIHHSGSSLFSPWNPSGVWKIMFRFSFGNGNLENFRGTGQMSAHVLFLSLLLHSLPQDKSCVW